MICWPLGLLVYVQTNHALLAPFNNSWDAPEILELNNQHETAVYLFCFPSKEQLYTYNITTTWCLCLQPTSYGGHFSCMKAVGVQNQMFFIRSIQYHSIMMVVTGRIGVWTTYLQCCLSFYPMKTHQSFPRIWSWHPKRWHFCRKTRGNSTQTAASWNIVVISLLCGCAKSKENDMEPKITLNWIFPPLLQMFVADVFLVENGGAVLWNRGPSWVMKVGRTVVKVQPP